MWGQCRFTCCLVSLVFSLSFLVGCRSNRTELLEAELRSLEQDVYHLRGELHRSEAQNDSLQRELGGVRKGACASPLPEQASQSCSLRQIVLGRGTGGYDDDNCPGDEGVQVVVEPRDQDNHTIKAPGTLYVQAMEVTPEGLKQPLSAWEVPPELLRRKWQSGLLSTGYRVILPWQNWPVNDKVRVIARFVLSDGRAFEAEKDITIRLTVPSNRKPVSLPVDETPVPLPTDQGIPLPPPRKNDPEGLPAPRKVEPEKPAETSSSLKPSWTNPAPPDVWRPSKPSPIHTAIELLPPVPSGILPVSAPRP